MYFNFITRPGNNQKGDLFNGFLFNRNRQPHGPSEMPSFQDTFQSAAGFFYPTDYGTIYGPGPSSRQADLQDFTSASPGASESSGSSQSLSPGAETTFVDVEEPKHFWKRVHMHDYFAVLSSSRYCELWHL